MFQLQKINDLLQQQNEELTPKDKKKKMKDKKESPKLFMPPPMYKELEKQVEILRSVLTLLRLCRDRVLQNCTYVYFLLVNKNHQKKGKCFL